MFDDLLPAAPANTTAGPPPIAPSGSGFDDLVPPKPAEKAEPQGNMITDIPSETYHAAKTAAGTVADALNPFSESRHAAYAKVAAEPTFMGGLGDVAQQTVDTGKGILAAPQVPFSLVTGPARSLLGHPLADVEHAIGSVINPEVAAKDNPAEMYETAKGDVDTAMSAMAPARGGLKTLVRGPLPTPPAPVPDGPLGVTLSKGQETGELPAIQREQAALRGNMSPEAQARAKQFHDQQTAQVARAQENVAKSFDPAGQIVAESPLAAADVVSQDLARREQLRSGNVAQESAALRPPNLPHPLDAADTVAQSLRNSADTLAQSQGDRELALQNTKEDLRASLSPTNSVIASNPTEAADIVSGAVGKASEDAQAATKAAYDALKELPGEFHPAAFNTATRDIKAALNKGTDPIKVSPQKTPQAQAALDDIDDILSSLKQTRDPDTGKIQPKEPSTPAAVDDVRKRLNSFYGNALQASRASNDWSDVRATRGVIDAFDDQVKSRLKKGTFIGGDPSDVVDAMDKARGLHSTYRKTFTSQGAGDTVGSAIQQIVGRYEGQAAPPNQIQGMLYGNGPLPVKIAKRFTSVFGADSPEIGAIKQGLFSYVTEKPEGVTAWGPEQVADRVYDFVNGKGRTLAQAYLKPEEIAQWRAYADNLRSSVAPPLAPTDVVARSLNKITGVGGQGATSAELADTLFGRSGIGENPLGVKLAQHIRDTYGPNSEPFNALRQGMMAKLTRADEGKLGFDPAAIAGQIDEFLDGRGRPMANTLYSPQTQTALRKYSSALRDHAADIAESSDPVDRAIAKISGRNGVPATPAEVRDLLWGRAIAQDKTVSIGLAKRLKDMYGENSPQWSAIKQGLFSKLVEPGDGLKDWGPGKVAQGLNRFLNVDGRDLANVVYQPQELQLIRQYADLMRQLEVPQAGANWSNNNPIVRALHRVGGWLGMAIGAALARHIMPFLPWEASVGIGAYAASQAQRLSKVIETRQIAKQMPLISDAMVKYQKSLKAIQKANTPPSRTAEAVAALNLSRALTPLGVSLRDFAVQGPGTAHGETDQKDIPRPPGQKKNGGGVDEQRDTPRRADGGGVHQSIIADSCVDGGQDKPESQKKSDWDTPTIGVSQNDQIKRANGGAIGFHPSPSEAQRKSGLYPKGHIRVHGLDVTIENARGSKRSGIGHDGKAWSVKMPNHYGAFRGTKAKDGDGVDCYIGRHIMSPHVFVIDQLDADTGKYDEVKCCLGFANEKQALRDYEAGFSDGKGKDRIGKVTAMAVQQFKRWLEHGDTKAPFRHADIPELKKQTHTAQKA